MRVIGILGGYALLGLSFLIVVEILSRKLLNFSLQGVDEIGGYVVAVTGTFGMALAVVSRAHTRIDVLLLRLPGRVQAWLNLLAYVSLGVCAAFTAWMGWRTLSDSLAFGAVSSTPPAGTAVDPAIALACGVGPLRARRALDRSARAARPAAWHSRGRPRAVAAHAGGRDRGGAAMIDPLGAAVGFVIMLGLMFIGLHVGVAMVATGVLGALVYFGPEVVTAFGPKLWSVMNDFLLTTIPLFVLLGELLLRAGITRNMYASLSDWLTRLPGGLLHTNIGACALFSAVSGSSVATAATIGTVALDEFKRRAYHEPLVLGTIAAGATLGILIPPSVNLIIYGALTNTSIGQLFAAGIIPGLLLTALFMAIIAVAALLRPALAERETVRAPRAERLGRLKFLLPPLGIFVIVMGAIYGGWATPTEAAALGVVLAFALAWANGALSFAMLHDAFIATIRTSAMLLFIITAAFFLNFIVGLLGVPQALSGVITDLGLTATEMILILVLFYLVMGCFLETLSMMVGTIPVVMPVVLHLGIDPVWFGIFLVIMMELALITPPVGMNLYVVQGVRGRGELADVYRGILPFVSVMLLMVAIITVWPGLVMIMPELLY